MNKSIVIKTSRDLKVVLDEFHKELEQKKGVKVVKYQSDAIFAEMAKIKLFNQPSLNADIRPAAGRRPRQVTFKL